MRSSGSSSRSWRLIREAVEVASWEVGGRMSRVGCWEDMATDA